MTIPKDVPRTRAAKIAALALLAALAATAGSAWATPPRADIEATRAPAHVAPAAEAFVTETRMFFPMRAADWHLIASQVLPDAYGNVQLRYASRKAKRVTADVFVYPGGLQPKGSAVHAEARAMLASFEDAERQGLYVITRRPELTGFTIARPPAEPLPMARIDFEHSEGDDPVVSSAVLVYRGLYFFKLRVTAPKEGAAQLERAIEVLLRQVMLPMRVVNFGNCGGTPELQRVASLPPDSDAVSIDGLQVAILDTDTQQSRRAKATLAASRRFDLGCSTDTDEKTGASTAANRPKPSPTHPTSSPPANPIQPSIPRAPTPTANPTPVTVASPHGARAASLDLERFTPLRPLPKSAPR